jgi:hypothetical protein
MWTKQQILSNLQKSDKWVMRAVTAIYGLQTLEEQTHETTINKNGIGFNATDAEILSSFAIQIKKRGFLSKKQMAIARLKIQKYSKQLLRLANTASVVLY